MRSTFYGLEASRTGLFTAQNALNLTGHNISNVDTVGYTRQRLDTAAIPAQAVNVQFAVDNRSTAGRGVEALTINQVRNLFTDIKYRHENTDTGYWSTMTEEFAIVESLFNGVLEQGVTSASIYSALDTFYTALNAVDAEPSSKDVRTSLLTAAEELTESFRYAYGKLQEQHEDINSAIKATVDEINGMAESIANLNKQIFGYELTGAKANDLRDERNLLLDELSELVNIDYYEDNQGYLVVTISGRELVNGVEYNKLTVDPRGVENQLDAIGNADIIGTQYSVVWADAMGQPSQNPRDAGNIQSGKLRAYLDLRDSSTETPAGIPYAANLLNELARKIAQEVNDVHRQGYTMPFMVADGTSDLQYVQRYQPPDYTGVEFGLTTATTDDGAEYYESTTGINFFNVGIENDYSKINAGNFQVSFEIKTNVFLIATSGVKVTVDGDRNANGTLNQNAGNQDNIKKLIALYDREDGAGNSDNFQDRLKSLVTSIGNHQTKNEQMERAQKVRLAAIEDERQSVSGVSLDEEMTNIVRFTHAYNANARVITAIDEELDTLINRLGTVGR